MIKIAAAVSGAWLLAGAVLLLPGMASVAPTIPMAPTGAMTTVPMAPMAPAGAMTTVPVAPTAPTAPAGAMTVNSLAKGDRLDIRSYGPGCSDRGWPYYQASCIRNANAANRDAKPVRIIALDHLPPGIELATSR
jgi:hypothetical protein